MRAPATKTRPIKAAISAAMFLFVVATSQHPNAGHGISEVRVTEWEATTSSTQP